MGNGGGHGRGLSKLRAGGEVGDGYALKVTVSYINFRYFFRGISISGF
jgi:hypothetical protein